MAGEVKGAGVRLEVKAAEAKAAGKMRGVEEVTWW